MLGNAFSWRAILRHDVIVALIILVSAPAQSKEPQVKAFLDGIYRHYLGSSVGDGKGIALTNPKIVREYFTMGLASLIIDDRAIETRYGERPALDGDPFVGRHGWGHFQPRDRSQGDRRVQSDRYRHLH